MDNPTIAQKLREYATQLSRRQENLFRVRSYRQAALVVQSLSQPITELVAQKGRAGLEALPEILVLPSPVGRAE